MFVNGIIFYYFENGLSFVRNYPAHAQAHTPQKKKWAAEGIHILHTHTHQKETIQIITLMLNLSNYQTENTVIKLNNCVCSARWCCSHAITLPKIAWPVLGSPNSKSLIFVKNRNKLLHNRFSIIFASFEMIGCVMWCVRILGDNVLKGQFRNFRLVICVVANTLTKPNERTKEKK